MVRSLTIVLALSALLSSIGPKAQSHRLNGAWRVVAVTMADGRIDTSPQPGLYVFTERHYSMQRVNAVRARLPEKPSDGELLAAFGPYTANSGTYELKGTSLTTRAIVAKNPNAMGGQNGTAEVRFEGNTVVHVTSPNPGGGTTVTRLERLE
jgi:hypothetical protein